MTSQPTRKVTQKKTTKKAKRKPTKSELIQKAIERSKKPHPQYGTSKLEEEFARNFLDKMGVRYKTQFEAKDIKRFYDFIVEDRILIEVDGSYYHAYGLVYEQMSPMQKKNYRVDQIKNKWALEHGYLLLRIWEHDIRENPSKVFSELKKILETNNGLKNKKKRH